MLKKKNLCSDDINKICDKFQDLPTVLPSCRRLIAIGDLHGDYEATINSFKLADLIDEKLDWKGGDTIVVQVGDQIDRCRPYKYQCSDERATVNDEASDIKILEFFTKLHEQALDQKGGVYSLLGNHEIMNVRGDMRYVSKKNIDMFNNTKFESGLKSRKYYFQPGNKYSNFLACTRQTAIIVGSYLFVHAGILPVLIKKYNLTAKNINKINIYVKLWLLGLIKEKRIKNLINHKISPFWTRFFGNLMADKDGIDKDCKVVEPILNTLNIKGMIVGHTPQLYNETSQDKKQISSCNGKIWKIDNGVSQAFQQFGFKQKVQVLEILNDNEINILSPN